MLLVCDIGGTNIRIRVIDILSSGIRSFQTEVYKTADSTSLEAALIKFVSEHELGGKIDRIICGIPGDVVNNKVDAIFLQHWGTVDGSHIRAALRVRECVLLNDLHCAAFSINDITGDDLLCLRPGRSAGGNVKALVAVGTGLGVSVCTKEGSATKYTPFASEAGWVRFAPDSELDAAFMKFIMHKHGISQICYNHVCSGSALLHHYEFFVGDQSRILDSAEDICASYERDTNAKAAVNNMLRYLGRFISQLCLMCKPIGGIYLAGGAMTSLGSLIPKSHAFEEGLTDLENNILREICQGPAIYHVTREDLGLLGASCYAFGTLDISQVKL